MKNLCFCVCAPLCGCFPPYTFSCQFFQGLHAKIGMKHAMLAFFAPVNININAKNASILVLILVFLYSLQVGGVWLV